MPLPKYSRRNTGVVNLSIMGFHDAQIVLQSSVTDAFPVLVDFSSMEPSQSQILAPLRTEGSPTGRQCSSPILPV